jgi:uncharacterized membrane protein
MPGTYTAYANYIAQRPTVQVPVAIICAVRVGIPGASVMASSTTYRAAQIISHGPTCRHIFSGAAALTTAALLSSGFDLPSSCRKAHKETRYAPAKYRTTIITYVVGSSGTDASTHRAYLLAASSSPLPSPPPCCEAYFALPSVASIKPSAMWFPTFSI